MFTSLLGLRPVYAATLLHGTVAGAMSPFVRQVVSAALVVVGAVLLVLVVSVFLAAAARIWRGQASARAKAVWVLSGTSLLYAGLTAVGRLPVTIDAAFLWRYSTLMTPAVCGLAIAAEATLISRQRLLARSLMIGWVVLAAVVWCNVSPERNAAAIARGKDRWIASYLKTRDLGAANGSRTLRSIIRPPIHRSLPGDYVGSTSGICRSSGIRSTTGPVRLPGRRGRRKPVRRAAETKQACHGRARRMNCAPWSQTLNRDLAWEHPR